VEGEVLTAKEVCALLRIHPSTLYKLTKQGRDYQLSNRQRLAIPNGAD
jgi:hypothetical protein